MGIRRPFPGLIPPLNRVPTIPKRIAAIPKAKSNNPFNSYASLLLSCTCCCSRSQGSRLAASNSKAAAKRRCIRCGVVIHAKGSRCADSHGTPSPDGKWCAVVFNRVVARTLEGKHVLNPFVFTSEVSSPKFVICTVGDFVWGIYGNGLVSALDGKLINIGNQSRLPSVGRFCRPLWGSAKPLCIGSNPIGASSLID